MSLLAVSIQLLTLGGNPLDTLCRKRLNAQSLFCGQRQNLGKFRYKGCAVTAKRIFT